MLTEREAVAIYEIKIQLKCQIMAAFVSPRSFGSLWGQTGPISKRYGVSSRTVKYIWNRQTWAHATKHLWPDEPERANFERTCTVFDHENCTSHSEIKNQPRAWTAEHATLGCSAARVDTCTTAPSEFEPTPSSLDKVGFTNSATAASDSGNAAPWIPPLSDQLCRGWPRWLHQCTDPRQAATFPDFQTCIRTGPREHPECSDSTAPALAAAVQTPSTPIGPIGKPSPSVNHGRQGRPRGRALL